jgi:hypothetical protein
MSIEDRRRTAEEIIAYLRGKGYIKTRAEIDSRTGECRISMIHVDGGSLWINLRDKPPSLLAEFCNVYEEVHAVAFGLIHSCTRLRPLGYSEIAEEDFSPELIADLQHEYHYYRAAFWAPRIVVALAILVATGSLETVGHLLGWG